MPVSGRHDQEPVAAGRVSVLSERGKQTAEVTVRVRWSGAVCTVCGEAADAGAPRRRKEGRPTAILCAGQYGCAARDSNPEPAD